MKPLAMALALLALALSPGAPAAAPPEAAPPPAEAKTALTIDSTFFELLADPRTRAVIDRHMPGFSERMAENEEVAIMFGGVTLANMAVDPDHGRMFTPQVLAMFAREFAEAQAAPPAGDTPPS